MGDLTVLNGGKCDFGLRRSQLLNLRNLLIIKQAKKRTVIPIINKVIYLFRTYYKAGKPKTRLFQGQYPYT